MKTGTIVLLIFHSNINTTAATAAVTKTGSYTNSDNNKINNIDIQTFACTSMSIISFTKNTSSSKCRAIVDGLSYLKVANRTHHVILL